MQIIFTTHCALLLSLLVLTQTAKLPISRNILNRKVRQVVPTSFKPICSPGFRLSSYNECVPNFKLPSFKPKATKPTSEFLHSFTSTSAPQSSTVAEFTTTPIHITSTTIKEVRVLSTDEPRTALYTFHMTTPHDEKISSTITNEVETETKFKQPISTTKLIDITSSPSSRSIRVPEKQVIYVMESSTNPSSSKSTTQISYLHYHNGKEIVKQHKCFYSKNHSTEILASSAYEDYDY